jgi:hypothetical protein
MGGVLTTSALWRSKNVPKKAMDISQTTRESLTKAKAVKDSSLPIVDAVLPCFPSLHSCSSSHQGRTTPDRSAYVWKLLPVDLSS